MQCNVMLCDGWQDIGSEVRNCDLRLNGYRKGTHRCRIEGRKSQEKEGE